MARLRHRLFGWACLGLVVMNVAAAVCGGVPGSSTRMPCCPTLGDDHALPTIEPCCAAEQRQQADPAGPATTVAAAQPAADASMLLGRVGSSGTASLLNHYPPGHPIGSPPDTHLLLSVFLI